MLPLVYRRLGDSLPRRALRTVRTLGLPMAVTGGPRLGGRSWGRPPLFLHGRAYPDRRVRGRRRDRAPRSWSSSMRSSSCRCRQTSDSCSSAACAARWVGSGPGCTSLHGRDGALGPRDLTTEARPVTAVESVPLWIGSPDRPLFAWLDVPDDGLVAGAAVICPSMGLEAAYSSRALRSLAHQLAGSRWAALRLDYAATGDSVGKLDRSRPRGRMAREHPARHRLPPARSARRGSAWWGSGSAPRWRPPSSPAAGRWTTWCCGTRVRRAGPFSGSRLPLPLSGASWPSSGASCRRPRCESRGRRPKTGWSRLRASCSPVPRQPTSTPLAVAWSDHSPASRELVLTREGRRIERAVAKRLTMPGVESSEIDRAGGALRGAARDAGADAGPDRLLASGSPADRWRGSPCPESQATAVHRAPGRAGVRERAVELGPARLFGVLSEPENGIDPSAPTVVFLNVGLIGHQGPGRLWVELARACAAAGGVRCLRADLSGIGDSPARPGRAELRRFPADALEDMDDIRRAMTADGRGAHPHRRVLGCRSRHRNGARGTGRGSVRDQSGLFLRTAGSAKRQPGRRSAPSIR